MKFVELKRIETKNLILRKFKANDVEDFFHRVAGNENVTKYMLWETHQFSEDTQKSVAKVLKRYEEGTTYTWAIALRTDNSVIGRIDLLRFDEHENSCSFAYMIGEEFWGKGFGTEALSAVLGFAFDEMELQVVLADHISENGASGAVMRNVGMRYVGKHISKYEKNGQIYDADEYRITSDEWRKLC